eukprot:352409-Chlamydomonas_euryale.AAC.4
MLLCSRSQIPRGLAPGLGGSVEHGGGHAHAGQRRDRSREALRLVWEAALSMGGAMLMRARGGTDPARPCA